MVGRVKRKYYCTGFALSVKNKNQSKQGMTHGIITLVSVLNTICGLREIPAIISEEEMGSGASSSL